MWNTRQTRQDKGWEPHKDYPFPPQAGIGVRGEGVARTLYRMNRAQQIEDVGVEVAVDPNLDQKVHYREHKWENTFWAHFSPIFVPKGIILQAFWHIWAVTNSPNGPQNGLKTHLQALKMVPGSLVGKVILTHLGPLFGGGTHRPKYPKTRLNRYPAGKNRIWRCVWANSKGWKPPKVGVQDGVKVPSESRFVASSPRYGQFSVLDCRPQFGPKGPEMGPNGHLFGGRKGSKQDQKAPPHCPSGLCPSTGTAEPAGARLGAARFSFW